MAPVGSRIVSEAAVSAWLVVLVICAATTPAVSIKCYECDSYTNLYCSENWSLGELAEEIQPTECKDTYEAQYCIKTTGMYQGEIGTRRFCSAKHLGNYCDWNSRPGDVTERGGKREYRACIYTCSSDGCNAARRPAPSLHYALQVLLIAAATVAAVAIYMSAAVAVR